MSEPGQAAGARGCASRRTPARLLSVVALASAVALGGAVLSACSSVPTASTSLSDEGPAGTAPAPGTPAGAPSAPGGTPGTADPVVSAAPTGQRVAAPRPPPFTNVRRNVRCTGPGTPAARRRAALLQNRLGPAAVAAGAHVAVAVSDLRTGVRCSLRGTRRFDSASIVKVAVVATLLRQARAENRSLSSTEQAWARASITRSDNAATSAMWRAVGRGPGMQRFLTAAGMTRTVAGPERFWGLTQVTADDQLKLLAVLSRDGLLVARDRGFLVGLMRDVVPSQRWGVPAGAPAGSSVGNKNGWLPRTTAGWRVHSIGLVSGGGRAYTVSLLSDHNSSWDAGITRLQTLARAAHLALR